MPVFFRLPPSAEYELRTLTFGQLSNGAIIFMETQFVHVLTGHRIVGPRLGSNRQLHAFATRTELVMAPGETITSVTRWLGEDGRVVGLKLITNFQLTITVGRSTGDEATETIADGFVFRCLQSLSKATQSTLVATPSVAQLQQYRDELKTVEADPSLVEDYALAVDATIVLATAGIVSVASVIAVLSELGAQACRLLDRHWRHLPWRVLLFTAREREIELHRIHRDIKAVLRFVVPRFQDQESQAVMRDSTLVPRYVAQPIRHHNYKVFVALLLLHTHSLINDGLVDSIVAFVVREGDLDALRAVATAVATDANQSIPQMMAACATRVPVAKIAVRHGHSHILEWLECTAKLDIVEPLDVPVTRYANADRSLSALSIDELANKITNSYAKKRTQSVLRLARRRATFTGLMHRCHDHKVTELELDSLIRSVTSVSQLPLIFCLAEQHLPQPRSLQRLVYTAFAHVCASENEVLKDNTDFAAFTTMLHKAKAAGHVSDSDCWTLLQQAIPARVASECSHKLDRMELAMDTVHDQLNWLTRDASDIRRCVDDDRYTNMVEKRRDRFLSGLPKAVGFLAGPLGRVFDMTARIHSAASRVGVDGVTVGQLVAEQTASLVYHATVETAFRPMDLEPHASGSHQQSIATATASTALIMDPEAAGAAVLLVETDEWEPAQLPRAFSDWFPSVQASVAVVAVVVLMVSFLHFS